MSAAPHAERADLAEIRAQLDRLYPGRLALLLTPLCSPAQPHEHRGPDGVMRPCEHPGKVPIGGNWNGLALERYQRGTGRLEYLAQMARHLASERNVGLVVPTGVLVLDADTQQAVSGLLAVFPDAPMQESRPGRAHVVVAVPEDAAINATVKLEIAPGITVDLRSAGRSQIAAAPSVHAATRAAYWWHRELPEDLGELPTLPAEWLARITQPRSRMNGSGTIGEGQRNAELFKIATGMRGRGEDEHSIFGELCRVNGERCRPPLGQAEVERIAASACRYEARRDAGAADADDRRGEQPREEDADPRRFFDGAGLVVPRLAEEIRGLGQVRIGVDGRLYRYAEGVYRGDGDAFARAHARRLLGDLFKRRHLDEALTFLRADFASVTDRQPEGLVNLRNGTLDWRAPVLELRPHDPGVVSTVQIPHQWNPRAKCPLIEKFLMEVLPADAITFLIEIVGYALLTSNPLRVAVLLLGPGRNGKSVLLLVVKALLGAENVSVATLQALSENRFAAAELFGKLANICGDLDARAIKQTDIFKMLVGGDPMLAERKHRDAFTFQPFALPLFSANEAPVSSDQTEAWFDRWLVVPMEKRIPEHQVDPHLVAKLITESEIEGLLVLAIEGLRRLMERGRFELPESVQAARGDYRERLDTVQGFVAERAVIGANCWTPRSDLYRAYRTWAQDSGRLPVSAQTFTDHLRRGFGDKIEERKREGARGWFGIGLLEEGRP